MSTDAEYLAYLNRANNQLNEGREAAAAAACSPDTRTSPFKARDDNAAVPAAISRALGAGDNVAMYISESDAPFEPVSLIWKKRSRFMPLMTFQRKMMGELPTESQFAKMIGHPRFITEKITIITPDEWDRDNNYSALCDAVREVVGAGDMCVYRVEDPNDGSIVEYWLVGREDTEEGSRIVGVKAAAVQS